MDGDEFRDFLGKAIADGHLTKLPGGRELARKWDKASTAAKHRTCRKAYHLIASEGVELEDLANKRIRPLPMLKLWRGLRKARDWKTFLEWLKEHWDEILKILLAILPLFILDDEP